MNRRFWLFGLPLLAATIVAGGAVWTLMAREHPPGDPGDEEQVALGDAVYDRDCARCHGNDLGGEFGWLKKDNEAGLSEDQIERMVQSLEDVAPAHDASGTTWRHDDETLFSIIKDGPAVALSKPDSRMPGFEGRLEDAEIWAVIAFLKAHWQEDGGTPE
jgi:mono/diheme cytochrome c family protein